MTKGQIQTRPFGIKEAVDTKAKTDKDKLRVNNDKKRGSLSDLVGFD